MADQTPNISSYVIHEKISMKDHKDFSERWLQERLAENPTLLGLGELDVRDLERRQPRAGRLDMLLEDPESNTRYEIELQLGATDESHIIRTIEYWDLERRRYPQYEHVAVIVAEDITARFFNVISLFNGFIPIVAIQVEAIQVGDAVTLVFTKVLDKIMLASDETDGEIEVRDRSYWEQKASSETLHLTEKLLKLIRQVQPETELKYNKYYVGLSRHGIVSNFVSFRPRKKNVIMEFKCPSDAALTERIDNSTLDSLGKDRWANYRLRISQVDIDTEEDLLIELITRAQKAYAS